MEEEEPTAKRRRRNNIEKEDEKAKKADCISGLPDHLLHEILACLPTRIAVRTSLLSRRWRTVWTTSPDLSFTRLPPSSVDSVLRLRDPAVALRSFSLATSDDVVSDPARVCSWIDYAANYSALQHLKLKLVRTDRIPAFLSFRLPTAVFRLQHLRVLELCLPRAIPRVDWPATAFLPSLQRLDLADLNLYLATEDAISNSCPALKYLRMSLYRGPPVLDVNCPLLEVFELTTYVVLAGRISICGSSVREVRVRQELARSAPAYLKLSAPALRTLEWLGQLPRSASIADPLPPDSLISSVVTRPGAVLAYIDVNDVLLNADLSVLRVNRLVCPERHITEVLGLLIFNGHNQVNPQDQEYKNLKHLEFAAFFGGFGSLGVAFLLRKFSKIQTMHITFCGSKILLQNFRRYFKAKGGFGPGGYWDSHNIRFENLVQVSVHGISGERYEYDFLEFLLRTATSLREIIIFADCHASSEVIAKKVEQLQRSFPYIEILL